MPKKKENYNNVKSTHPVLSPDGKYRWVYYISMLRNPSILFDVLWVIAISFGIVCLFVLLIRGCEGELRLEKPRLRGRRRLRLHLSVPTPALPCRPIMS